MISEIDSVGLKDRITAGEDVYLVDIRTPMEVAQAAIPNAVHIPCLYLAQQGFDKAINLRGGIIAWARHGFEIQPGLSA